MQPTPKKPCTTPPHLRALTLLLLCRQRQRHALRLLVLAQQLGAQPVDLLLDVRVAGREWGWRG